MKIMSFNIIGVGNRTKWKVVRDIVVKEKVEMLFIQETKSQQINARLCCALWGDGDFEWRAVHAVNRSGGILCVWKKKMFCLEGSFEGPGFVGLIGTWEYTQCVVVNVSSSCVLEEKRLMWDMLVQLKGSSGIQVWCVAGDFNAVGSQNEKKREWGGRGAGGEQQKKTKKNI